MELLPLSRRTTRNTGAVTEQKVRLRHSLVPEIFRQITEGKESRWLLVRRSNGSTDTAWHVVVHHAQLQMVSRVVRSVAWMLTCRAPPMPKRKAQAEKSKGVSVRGKLQ